MFPLPVSMAPWTRFYPSFESEVLYEKEQKDFMAPDVCFLNTVPHLPEYHQDVSEKLWVKHVYS